MKLEKTERTYLSEGELKEIEAFQATPDTRLDLHRDMFVFAAYAGWCSDFGFTSNPLG